VPAGKERDIRKSISLIVSSMCALCLFVAYWCVGGVNGTVKLCVLVDRGSIELSATTVQPLLPISHCRIPLTGVSASPVRAVSR
jgi:hypothetical protein